MNRTSDESGVEERGNRIIFYFLQQPYRYFVSTILAFHNRALSHYRRLYWLCNPSNQNFPKLSKESIFFIQPYLHYSTIRQCNGKSFDCLPKNKGPSLNSFHIKNIFIYFGFRQALTWKKILNINLYIFLHIEFKNFLDFSYWH